jgi:hypothetical protein
MRPFDSQRKSLMVIGDSVSIGYVLCNPHAAPGFCVAVDSLMFFPLWPSYTPFIASALNASVDVQHSPDSGDGGACESACKRPAWLCWGGGT